VDTRYLLAGALGILLAIDVHECMHAWTADRLGDPTARLMGRVSLNPLVHLDPLGTAMMALAAFSGRGIGWGKPVPVNPLHLKYGPRVGMGLVSLAGPLANLATAGILGLPFRLGIRLPGLLPLLLLQMLFINIGLAAFNLIPLPPLDGYGVLQGIVASVRGPTAFRLSQKLATFEQQGALMLFLLIIASQYIGIDMLGGFMDPVVNLFSKWILGL